MIPLIRLLTPISYYILRDDMLALYLADLGERLARSQSGQEWEVSIQYFGPLRLFLTLRRRKLKRHSILSCPSKRQFL
jgi:hypothetical protein